jgi:hypothetical protein
LGTPTQIIALRGARSPIARPLGFSGRIAQRLAGFKQQLAEAKAATRARAILAWSQPASHGGRR